MTRHATGQFDRYQRQSLLPQIGGRGQAALADARVLLVGCGALGCHAADQLIRGGVGYLRLVDRDLIELTNLQRQTLFDEDDVGSAKAAAGARRLGRINSQVTIEPVVADVWAGNIHGLCEGIHLILDGADNVQTRYLLNDLAIERSIPWIHAACVGVEGRVMAVVPGQSACLRCVFPTPPAAGELPTCDTAGILQPAAASVAALQVAQAIKILTGHWTRQDQRLWTLDVWSGRFNAIDLSDARQDDCPCCGQKQFPFLQSSAAESAIALCGRKAVQIRPPAPWTDVQFGHAVARLSQVGHVEGGAFFSRCTLRDPRGMMITCFKDGRVLVDGTTDTGRAKAICARFIGT